MLSARSPAAGPCAHRWGNAAHTQPDESSWRWAAAGRTGYWTCSPAPPCWLPGGGMARDQPGPALAWHLCRLTAEPTWPAVLACRGRPACRIHLGLTLLARLPGGGRGPPWGCLLLVATSGPGVACFAGRLAMGPLWPATASSRPAALSASSPGVIHRRRWPCFSQPSGACRAAAEACKHPLINPDRAEPNGPEAARLWSVGWPCSTALLQWPGPLLPGYGAYRAE